MLFLLILNQLINYRLVQNWAQWPSDDFALKADLFYIYPTVYTSFFNNNAPIDDPDYRQKVHQIAFLQSSIFYSIARIYTPYYRQASLWAYFDTQKSTQKSLDRAYADIRSAFKYYLKYQNQGRPLFILAHSQGSQMAVRILKEFEYWIQDRLIAAYLIGEKIGTDTFHRIKPCQSEHQVRCFITWATVAKGGRSQWLTGRPVGPSVCINPLSWRMDEKMIRAYFVGLDDMGRWRSAKINAQCQKGLLFIDPAPDEFDHEGSDYHASDINLFYGNIRQNAQKRMQSFQK